MGKNNQVIEARSGKNYVFEPTNKHFCASYININNIIIIINIIIINIVTLIFCSSTMG